ncbi:MAG: hypothetical protein WAV93_02635 [Bacteroidales bacterium]
MKRLELILILGASIGLLLSLFNVTFSSLIVSLFFVALGLLYFYLGFALFNGIHLRKIFDPASYKGIGSWRIAIAAGAGLALSMLTIGFMFTILCYPMSKTLLIAGLVCTAMILILAVIKNTKDKNKFNRNIILRCLVYLIIAVIFLFIPAQIFEKP